MKYRILNTQLRRIMAEARQAAKGGMEICGLLIDNGYFIEMIGLTNKSKKVGKFSFSMKEADAIEKACKKLNHEIVGTFHSHPFSMAEPGDSDIAKAFDNEIMLIIDVINKEAKLWRLSNKKKKELRFMLLG
jgi:proteasome lid subunit RPN8/RPN11